MILRRLLPPNFPLAWWLPYSWLVYLSFFIVIAILRDGGALWWGLHLLAVVAFLTLYFRGYWLEGRRVVPIVAAILGLGVGFLPWNAGASVFFVYAAGFVCDIGPPRIAVRWLAGIVVMAAIEALFFHLGPDAWLPSVVLPVIIGGGNIAYTEKRRADDRLRLAQDEVAHLAKVAERERIARDLHDLLGHTLSIIVLKSELAAKLSDCDPGRAVSEIRDVERISRQALAEVRRAVEGYRELTLRESLAGVRQALIAADVTIDEEVSPVSLTPGMEAVASLVLREAITNVVRHAKASTCRIRVHEEGEVVTIVVSDDGIGGVGREGTGLSSMRTRVEQAGGQFLHDGTAGTTLRVELPHGAALTGGAPRSGRVTT